MKVKIAGREYQVIRWIEDANGGQAFPIVDIPLMSDERWNELANAPEQIAAREAVKKAPYYEQYLADIAKYEGRWPGRRDETGSGIAPEDQRRTIAP
jgi:hypothetical protein